MKIKEREAVERAHEAGVGRVVQRRLEDMPAVVALRVSVALGPKVGRSSVRVSNGLKSCVCIVY